MRRARSASSFSSHLFLVCRRPHVMRKCCQQKGRKPRPDPRPRPLGVRQEHSFALTHPPMRTQIGNVERNGALIHLMQVTSWGSFWKENRIVFPQ